MRRSATLGFVLSIFIAFAASAADPTLRPVATLLPSVWSGAAVACDAKKQTCWLHFRTGLSAHVKSDDILEAECRVATSDVHCHTVAVTDRCVHLAYLVALKDGYRTALARDPDGYGYTAEAAQKDCRDARKQECTALYTVGCSTN